VMGKKERIFSPLPRDVSLEDLVPKDNSTAVWTGSWTCHS